MIWIKKSRYKSVICSPLIYSSVSLAATFDTDPESTVHAFGLTTGFSIGSRLIYIYIIEFASSRSRTAGDGSLSKSRIG